MKKPDYLDEICSNCGCTYCSHHGGSNPWPYNYCPGHEGHMDWDKGPGTIFKPSGKYKEEHITQHAPDLKPPPAKSD